MMRKRFTFIILMLAGLLLLIAGSVQAFREKDQPVDVIVVKGAIFPATAGYIERGIKQAEKDGAICIIQMDTPGGLIKSMREIIQAMQASQVPVVVYVAPSGAMATSAGTYITYASHVAAMAPGTHIGSAHPVGLGRDNKRRKMPPLFGDEKDRDKDSDKNNDDKDIKDEEKTQKEKPGKTKRYNSSDEIDVGMEKATNAMVALIRSLAEKSGRNADWGEKAVRESVSITSKKALELNVVEINADDLRDLLEQLKGMKVQLPGKRTVTLYPSQNDIKYIEMTAVEKFLSIINDPQIAIILVFFGVMGLYLEFSHPGIAIPGIVGSISLILALYTFGSLPINYTALALIILSVILFIAEAFTPTFGAFTTGGVISFVLGAVFLIPPGVEFVQISIHLILSLAVLMAIVSFIVFTLVAKSMKRKPVSGREGMIGEKGKVKEPLDPEGVIMIEGELWSAVSTGDIIPVGKIVKVERIEGLNLYVKEDKEDVK